MQSQLAERCTIPVQFSAFDRTSDARVFRFGLALGARRLKREAA
jgi:hypothetical protein